LSTVVTYTVFAAVFLLIFVTILLRIKIFQKQKQIREAGLVDFEDGGIILSDLNMRMNNQDWCKTFNKNLEFPKKKLKFGKKLGSGAFGVVFEAVAEGIYESEKETIVAVKMVNKPKDDEALKALASELKIMVQLGKHTNIVNLLGAVTKNLIKRELLVLVEFCKFGNLRSFLLRHRADFSVLEPNLASSEDQEIGSKLTNCIQKCST
jgi:FMS-like tyrosine kinase 1